MNFADTYDKLNTLYTDTKIDYAKLTADLKKEFGNTATGEGSSYIIPDGTFLNMPDTHHDVIPVLLDNNIAVDEEADEVNGIDFNEFFVNSSLNYFRCNDGAIDVDCCYINLPENRPTNSQLWSLEQWLDERVFSNHELEQIELSNQFTKDFKYYSLSEYTTDDLIKLIKRFYASGKLYEKLSTK
jgi:hypothetical protein